MARKRNAKFWAKEVQDGECECDTALEEHLHSYRGPLAVPPLSKVHLALCSWNMGWQGRVLQLRDGPRTVSEIIQKFDLEPFLPLFDEQEDATFSKGDVVCYESAVCVVIGRRHVTTLAVPCYDEWEVFIEALDETTAGFVGESELVEQFVEEDSEDSQ